MLPLLTGLLRMVGMVCAACLGLMMVYQLVLSFFGFGRKVKDYQDHDPESRFLVLVPAHNEEKVIGDIVRNLQAMDYPKELYDFYIIADNCTDATAETARKLGANVIETRKETEDSPTGKPIALRKALLALGDYQNRYDLMMIFDADNLMDTNMFREVNSQYLDKGRPDFIQCYLGAKNKKGVVAWFYYTGYTLTNRFFDLAKHRLGLNCAIGGTGFAMSTKYLYERGGWTNMSLTEDFEIQVEATLEGRRILWNHVTRVYDEKPTSMRASIRQKIRWGQGHWYVAFRNTGKLFRALGAGTIGFGEFLSLLTYMYSISAYVLTALQLLTGLALALLAPGTPLVSFSLEGLVWGVLLFGYSYLFLFYVADWLDNGIAFSLKTIPVMIGGFVANMIVGVFNQVVGLLRFRDQQHWDKTEHAIGAAQTIHGVKTVKLPPKAA
ncbi:MAG: glycosyltransferase family 2 protein [Clostridia bacterium]|nr:glycosyltransferase family 2 protein [Clostridia bacterium]